jgi:hypothetical protein
MQRMVRAPGAERTALSKARAEAERFKSRTMALDFALQFDKTK